MGSERERLHNILGRSTPDVRDLYEFNKIIGKGAFGTIYHVVEKATGAIYACKTIPKRKLTNRTDVDMARKEVAILQHLSGHENIVGFKGAYEDRHDLHMVLELCDGGALYDAIIKRGSYSERYAAALMRTILETVVHCHKNGVIHRDLKPENFLLPDGSSTVLKLTDFGLSDFFKEGQVFYTLCGTAYYMAPEVIKERYTLQADVWSCGVIMYVLLSGRYPFDGKTEQQVYDAISRGQYKISGEQWGKISSMAKDCLARMLTLEPQLRPTAADILKHEWLQAETAPDIPLDDVVLSRLRNFVALNLMKKAAGKFIAAKLPVAEVEQLRKVFESYDLDKDGVVSVKELMQVMRHKHIPEKEVQKTVEALDTDQDGVVSYEEFLTATVSYGKNLREEQLYQAFKSFDVDNSGYITREELRVVLKMYGQTKQEDIDKVIETADADHNGQIDYAEFCKFLRQEDTASASPAQNLQDKSTFKDVYKFGEVLHQGQFGTMYEVTDTRTGERFACKTILRKNVPEGFAALAEARVLQALQTHPNIIALREVFESPNTVYIVMELCSGGELFQHVLTKKHYSEADAAAAMKVILSVVEHCHKKGIMHRDLKPENFMLTHKGGDAVLKAADLGFATFFRGPSAASPAQNQVVGSLYYIAPEVLAQKYGPEVDMWSCGVILYVLLTGRYPFKGASQQATFDLIRVGKFDLTSERCAKISEPAKDCIRRMLTQQPQQRATAAEILAHPWMVQHTRSGSAPSTAPPPLEEARKALKKMSALNSFVREAMRAMSNAMSEADKKALQERFMALDKDGDGSITVQELTEFLRRSQAGPRQIGDVDEWVQARDLDGDGNVDYTEFVSGVMDLSSGQRELYVRSAFSYYDVNGDGRITRRELLDVLTKRGHSEEEVDDLLAAMDINCDGGIDYVEFCQALRRTSADVL